MVGNGRHEHAMQRRDQSALLRMQRLVVVDGTDGRLSHASLSDIKQALELGGNVRRGEHGTKVYFVKQLHVHDKGSDDNSATRLVPMMREYTVFNVAQCENLPDSIFTGKPMRVRNSDMRDEFADAFLHSTGADIREGQGEAFYVPSRDFISMPAFDAFKGADLSTTWPSMNSRIGLDTSRALIEI